MMARPVRLGEKASLLLLERARIAERMADFWRSIIFVDDIFSDERNIGLPGFVWLSTVAEEK